jgi:hypothetical protein
VGGQVVERGVFSAFTLRLGVFHPVAVAEQPGTTMKCIVLVAMLITGVAAAESPFPVYIGCYLDCDSGDSCPGNRDFSNNFCNCPTNNATACSDPSDAGICLFGSVGAAVMTPHLCSVICTGYKFFGLQENQCFCGNEYGNQGGKASSDSECDYPCPGDNSTMCGASHHNSIYAQPTQNK